MNETIWTTTFASPPHRALPRRGLLPVPMWALALAALWLAAGASGCATAVGDGCTTNIECSVTGERICDTAQPGGYCTVEGCGSDTCPDGAVCIGFFPAAFLSVPCDPSTEDAVDPNVATTDDCNPDEVCLSSGRCAQFSLERRFCMKPCDDDGDCRSGYVCRVAGTAGAEPVVARDATRSTSPVRFCAQRI